MNATANQILSPELPAAPDHLRAAITAAWMRDEAEHVRELLAASPDDTLAADVEADLADLPAWMQEGWTSLRA